MAIRLEISFKDLEPSPAIEARIREKAARLERFHERIVGCHVTVEAPHRRHRHGKLYRIRIDLSLPGKDVFVDRAGPQDHAHEDVYVAIRDAFDAAVRQLEDHARRMRGDVKAHEVPDHGRIARLLGDYGFIDDTDGREVYFHRNSVVDGSFEQLNVGDEVRLTIDEEEGLKGPQASSVRPVGKHHVAGP
jgi:ribosomal subunit interface protein